MPVLQILHVFFMGICFLFKTNSLIRHFCVPIDEQFYEPFCHIPQIEEYVKQLLHLLGMNTFVIKHFLAWMFAASYEERPKEVYCIEPLEGNDVVVNYFHYLILISCIKLIAAGSADATWGRG